jgi:limonene-1,2-epoxide hydrolase
MTEAVKVVTAFINTINEGPEGFNKAMRLWFTDATF